MDGAPERPRGPRTLVTAAAFVEIARPGNVAMAGIGVVIGALVVGLEAPSLAVALATLATMLVVAGGNAFNDITDVDVDRHVHQARPIPSGRLSVRAAMGMAIASLVVAAVLAIAVSVPLLLLVLAAEAVLLAYEVHLKASGLVGNLVVALLVGATFVAGALAVGTLSLTLWLLASLAFLANVAREVWKDAEDLAGDQGRRTLARTHGPGVARTVGGLLTLAAVALSPLPWLLADFGGRAYLATVAVADVLFLAAIAVSWAGHAQRLAKAAMVVALAAFALGALV